MDIILLERVGSLGNIGDVVTVKDGFARNFLLPNKKALRANAANKKVFEENRERLEAENAERRDAAAKEGKKLDNVTIELIRQASQTGQLYGSVAVRDIVAALEERGETVTKKQVVLERPIKAIGMYEVAINLHAEVDITVKVNVARSPEEAEKQAAGIDVIAEMFEEAQAEIVQEELAGDAEAEGKAEKAADSDASGEEAAEGEGEEAAEAGTAEESPEMEGEAQTGDAETAETEDDSKDDA